MQLWFLSVLFNVFSGLVLIFSAESDLDEPSAAGESAAPALFQNKTFRLVLGILTALVGVIKLFAVMAEPGKRAIPVLGDFLPALAGAAGGGALLIGYVIASSSGFDIPAPVHKIFVDEKKYVGIICIIIAVLHFIFPQALFL
jgi:hypothetical protein